MGFLFLQVLNVAVKQVSYSMPRHLYVYYIKFYCTLKTWRTHIFLLTITYLSVTTILVSVTHAVLFLCVCVTNPKPSESESVKWVSESVKWARISKQMVICHGCLMFFSNSISNQFPHWSKSNHLYICVTNVWFKLLTLKISAYNQLSLMLRF